MISFTLDPKYVPLWVAPNLLTFAGFFLNVANFCLITYYDLNIDATSHPIEHYPIPRWVFLVVSINFFLAYTIDNIDGAQARRTGSASPLGEVIDHGLDVYSANFIMGYIFSLFGKIGFSVMWMHLVTFTIYLSFYVSLLEIINEKPFVIHATSSYSFHSSHNITRKCCLFLSHTIWSCLGVLWLRLPLSCLDRRFTFAIRLFPGFRFQHTKKSFTFRQFLQTIRWLHGIFSSNLSNFRILINLSMIKSFVRSYRDKTGHMRSFNEALKPLYTFFAFFIVSTIWTYFSPNAIVDHHPRIFFLTTGTIFTNFCVNSRNLRTYLYQKSINFLDSPHRCTND